MKKIIIIILIMWTTFTISSVKAEAPNRTLKDYSVKELITYYSKQYGSNSSQVEKVMFCESGNNERAWNKKDPGVGSKGLMQFQESTFYGYAARITIKNPDIWDKQQQIEVASYMFSKGLAYHWSCAKILGIVK